MTPTVFSSELLELLERYRRRYIHLVKPSVEPWQLELDAETYFGKTEPIRETPSLSL